MIICIVFIDVLRILNMYHIELNNKIALIHKYFNSSVKLLIVFFSSLEMLNKFYEHLYSLIYSINSTNQREISSIHPDCRKIIELYQSYYIFSNMFRK